MQIILPKKFILSLNGYPDVTKCWEWQGRVDRRKQNPYPMFSLHGIVMPAHRFCWEETYNEHLQSDTILISTCGNPLCVNPFHREKMSKSKHQRELMKKIWKSYKENN